MDKITIVDIILASITTAMLFFAVYSFKRTLKESWRDSLIIAASDFIGALESLRMEKISQKKPGDSKILGDIISAQKRLKILLIKKEKHNIFDLAEDLRDKAEKGELINEYGKKENNFIEMILLISK